MLATVALQHFRSYNQHTFHFDPGLTIVIGPNTAGKTNLTEAILLLSTGKSIRAEKDIDMITFEKEVAHVKAKIDDTTLEVTLARGEATGGRFVKKFSVNGVAKSRNHFVGFLPTVLFRPEELEIIIDGPSLRRKFLDDVLEQVDIEYRRSRLIYDKALRQRNALLHIAREQGSRNPEQFRYWDELLIANGTIITQKREEFLAFVNKATKEIMDISVVYDKSSMSVERLAQYADAEIGAGVTLVGPQRDDFSVFMQLGKEKRDMQHFGSRGQQRLAVLQLKQLQLVFMRQILGKDPLLVLDDIFSELDDAHISLVLSQVGKSQIILTTTHAEFVKNMPKKANVIKLER